MFIAIEGIDGAGKGTQLELLAQALTDRGHRVHRTCEPSGWPIGTLLRRYLRRELTEAVPSGPALSLLFAADRLQHVEAEILPHLAAAEVVLCDRYDGSSIAYQAAMDPRAAEDPLATMTWIAMLNERAPRPTLTLVLDLDPELAQERRARRGNDGDLLEQLELQRRVRHLYRQLHQVRPRDQIFYVDAAPPVATVHAAILEIVLQHLDRSRDA